MLFASISGLEGTAGSEDTDGTDGLNISRWKKSAGCWDLWLFPKLLPSWDPTSSVRGCWWKNPHRSATTVSAKSIWHCCISIIDNINYAHCYFLPWESQSIQVNVFKSVECLWPLQFLMPLNGKRTKVFSRKAQAWGNCFRGTTAEELLLFHTKLPMVRAVFPLWGIWRWEKSSTYHIPVIAIIKCFYIWKSVRTAWSFLPGKRWSLNAPWAPVLYCCLPFHYFQKAGVVTAF